LNREEAPNPSLDPFAACCQVVFSGVEITSSFVMFSEGVAREALFSTLWEDSLTEVLTLLTKIP
jgi:hypothetical protein